MVFSCDCGNINLAWINPDVKRLCNMCGSRIRFMDKSKQISLQAFNKAKETISVNQEIILDIINTLKSCNNKMIAKCLEWPINRVTPRVKELRDLDYVVLDKIDKDKDTNTNTMFWKVNN